MLSMILLGILLVAALLAAGASRLRLSPWWVFLPAGVAVALGTSSDVASCSGADSVEALFSFAILFALGFFATAAFTALFDAVRFARQGETSLAFRRVIPARCGRRIGVRHARPVGRHGGLLSRIGRQ
jgi:hypothetical protein